MNGHIILEDHNLTVICFLGSSKIFVVNIVKN